MDAISTRLKRLEKSGRPAVGGLALLLLMPDQAMSPSEPRASLTGPRGENLTVRYPESALDVVGDLAVGVEALIPEGPDHSRLVRMARSARRTVLVNFPPNGR